MVAFLAILANNKSLIFGVILLMAAGYTLLLRQEISKLKTDLVTMTMKFEVANASVKTLQTDIGVQNDAVDKIKSDADKQYKAYLDDLLKQKKVTESYQKKAADLLNRVAPANVDQCDAANQLFNEVIQNAK